MLIVMDGSSPIPPEMANAMAQQHAVQEDDSHADPSALSVSSPAPSHPALSPIQQGLGAHGSTENLSLKKQLQILSPKSFLDSVTTQLLGEKTPQQQEAERAQEQKLQQRIAQARQDWETWQAKRKAEEQKRIQETIQLKEEAQKVGTYAVSSAVRSQTTQGDLGEQAIIRQAIADAQAAKERAQKTQQALSVQTTAKGPQAEGGQKKTSMIARMQGGGENDNHKLSDDADSRQRQSEQAMGE